MGQLTQELLEMFFEELGEDLDTPMTFAEWASNVGYDPTSWTDQQIYNALPAGIKAYILDIGMNWSWLHGGM